MHWILTHTWEILYAKQLTPNQKSQQIFYFSMLYLDAMESMWAIMWVCEVKYVGVIWFILYVLQLLLNRLTQPNLCNYISYLQWSKNKIWTYPDLVMEDMFVD